MEPYAARSPPSRRLSYDLTSLTLPGRPSRLLELQLKIASGRYAIDPAQVADAFVRVRAWLWPLAQRTGCS